MMDKNENKAMIEAVALLAKEKNIGKEVLFSAIEEALKSAYKNNFNSSCCCCTCSRNCNSISGFSR